MKFMLPTARDVDDTETGLNGIFGSLWRRHSTEIQSISVRWLGDDDHPASGRLNGKFPI